LSEANLEREFRRELDSRLKKLGFERSRTSWLCGDYSREIAGVQQVLGIRIEPYVDDLEAEIVNASVRFNDVEDIVAKFEDPHPLIGPEDIAARSTLTAQTSSIKPGPSDPLRGWGGENRKVWLVRSRDEIPSIASEIVACVSKECEPTLAALSNPDHALVLLSGDDEQSRSYSGPDASRAKRSIALALLLRGGSAARELAKTKSARLKGEPRAEVEKWTDRLFQAEGVVVK
jgi:hypothetical protein